MPPDVTGRVGDLHKPPLIHREYDWMRVELISPYVLAILNHLSSSQLIVLTNLLTHTTFDPKLSSVRDRD